MNPHCRECDAVEKQNGRRGKRYSMWLIQNKQKFEQKLHFLRFVDYVSFRLCAESGRMKNTTIPGMSALDLLNFEDNVPAICFTELMLEQLAVAREIHRRRRTFRTLSFRRTIKYEHRRRIPTGQDEVFITHVAYEASCQEKNQRFCVCGFHLFSGGAEEGGPSATWNPPKINFSINDPINMSEISDWTRNFGALFIDAVLSFRLARNRSRDHLLWPIQLCLVRFDPDIELVRRK
jgi:hypothetical protein